MYRKDLFQNFQDKKKPLRNVMVWGRLYNTTFANKEPITVVLNKDGSVQTTLTYHGPDLDSSIQAELAMITVQLNQLLTSMGTNYVLYFESQRKASTAYPKENFFPDDITKAIDMERESLFSDGYHYESTFYATVYFMPPIDRAEKVKEMFIEGRERKTVHGENTIKKFLEQVLKIYNAFQSLRIPIRPLTANETISYLHSTVSDNPRKMRVPAHPLILDKYMYDTPLYGGLEPRLNKHHIRVIVPLKYPKATIFGFLDVLNRLDFSYRWSTRCYCMSKNDTLSVLTSLRKAWKSKLQSLWSYFVHRDDPNIERYDDQHVTGLLEEIEEARMAVEADTFGFVYYTTAVVVMDKDRDEADRKARIVQQTLIELGFTKVNIETVNAIEAWMGTLPGLVGRNVRRELVSTGNFVHLMPISDIWAGPDWNKHLDGPPLLYTETSGNTPFRLNLHIGQIGHTMLVGDTGAGKSVHLCCIEAAFRRYKNARVIIFDNGKSSKVLTYGVGGKFYDLADEKNGLSFQPLGHVDNPHERQWALEWLCDFLREENIEITPRLKGLIRDDLNTLAASPEQDRTISTFIDYLQDEELKMAFSPLAGTDYKGNIGEYGSIFDADQDTLRLSSWQTFEMGKIITKANIIGPTLMYIFHRIENILKGYDGHDTSQDGPTLIVLDECWMFFKNPIFAAKIEDWLRTLRKFNASVLFATQSLDDVVNSPLFDIILGSCKTHIFLPDEMALEPKRQKVYSQFKLNERQMEILAHAKKQRDYYYVSTEGARLYNLGLNYCPLTLSYVAAGKKEVNRCEQIVTEYGDEHFNEHWLREHNLQIPWHKEGE